MSALITAAIYFGSFLAIAVIAKLAVGRWLNMRDIDLSEIRTQLENIIETVAPRYDRILLDTGAGISDVVLYAVSLADEVLVLATSEPTSMTDAYATIKVLATQQQHPVGVPGHTGYLTSDRDRTGGHGRTGDQDAGRYSRHHCLRDIREQRWGLPLRPP